MERSDMPTRRLAPIMTEIDFNVKFEFETKYALLNKDRLGHAVTCDVEIILGEDESPQSHSYSCHKEVLSKSFGYFRTRFAKQNVTCNPALLRTVKDAPFTNFYTLEKLLGTAYTGKLLVSKSDAYNVLRDCLFLEFEYVTELWNVIFERNYFTPQALDFFVLFQRYWYKSQSWYDVIKHIATRFNEEKYLAAPLETIEPLLHHLPGYVENKERLLDFVVRWGQRDYARRRHSIPVLLNDMYVKKVSGAFAKDLAVKLFQSEHLYRSESRRKFVAENETKTLRTFVHMKNGSNYYVFEYKLALNGEWHYASAEIVHRQSISKFVLLRDRLYNLRAAVENADRQIHSYAFKCAPITSYKSVLKVDCEHARTLKPPSLKPLINNFQVAVLDTNIYLYGTSFSEGYVARYNCARDEWQPVLRDCLPFTKKSIFLSHDECLYLLGGDSDLRGGNVLRYDRRTDRWYKLPPMLQTHSYGAACSFGGKIYVAGGRNHAGETTNTVEIFDFVANKWDLISSLNTKREFFVLLPYNNGLWAIGHQCTLSMEWYDPANDCWSMCEKSLVRARGESTLVNLWKPRYRYVDYDDPVPALVLDAVAF